MKWIANLVDGLGKIFGTAGEIAEKIKNPEQRKIAKLEYRIEAAMDYVHCNEGVGEFADFNETKRQKYLRHYRKRIFDV